ncbi:MAG: uracil-DNA glycosylase, partial [Patescibacteria group bacterium]
MNSAEKKIELAKIAAEIADCRACRLCEQRTKTVPGSGNPDAEILFVGEGPGKSEDEQGEP